MKCYSPCFVVKGTNAIEAIGNESDTRLIRASFLNEACHILNSHHLSL